jgi:hypothetical protein
MSQLINEILLRFVKLVAAGLIGLILYADRRRPAPRDPSFELAAVCWISGAVLIC